MFQVLSLFYQWFRSGFNLSADLLDSVFSDDVAFMCYNPWKPGPVQVFSAEVSLRAKLD